MPQYKLTYFGVRARGETPRWLFALAGQEYQDDRISMEQWPELKPKTPMGVLPLLDVDGTTIHQSSAINRFLARTFGLGGDSSLEQAQVESIMDSVEDACTGILPIFFCQDPDTKTKMQTEHREKKLVPVLTNLERILGTSNYFVADKLTVADVHASCMLDTSVTAGGDAALWDAYPALKALRARVSAHDKIAAWIKQRPQTPY